MGRRFTQINTDVIGKSQTLISLIDTKKEMIPLRKTVIAGNKTLTLVTLNFSSL